MDETQQLERMLKIMAQEPKITINGVELDPAQAGTVRVAIESFFTSLDKPTALGRDAHGKFMVKAYKARLDEIGKLMFPKEEAKNK